MRVLITGGAGFIGSHLTEALAQKGYSVVVLDNLSSGSETNLINAINDYQVEFLRGDCRNPQDVKQALEGRDTIFHFAANPEVRLELADPQICYEQNIEATYILLEKARKSKIESIVYASSSTVYGDAQPVPTPESYGPLKPISVYGASKLASEALVSSYCHCFKKKGYILRLANIVGPRSTHGVIYDFISKLKTDPAELEILGDGTQTKSYLYINDCIDATLKIYEKAKEQISIYNVGSDDQINVKEIARIAVQAMKLNNVKLKTTGGVNNGRGWAGDVKNMMLDTNKLKSLGWKPKCCSAEALKKAAADLLKSANYATQKAS
jgi:UDP-glucose 4-epimerase